MARSLFFDAETHSKSCYNEKKDQQLSQERKTFHLGAELYMDNRMLTKENPLNEPVRFRFDTKDQIMQFGSELEILYVLAGRVIVSFPSQSYTLEPEDIIVFNRYQMHSVSYLENGCSTSLLFSYFLIENIRSGAINCNSTAQPELREVFDEIRGKMASLYQFCIADSDTYDLYLLSECYELLGILKQHFQTENQSPNQNREAFGWLAPVLAYLEEHSGEELSLQGLSERFHLSQGHLSRTMKQCLGMSYTEYLRKLRIGRAKRLLRQRSLSVTDISMECGFRYVNTFIEAFKKEVGTTPSAYRKQFPAQETALTQEHHLSLAASKLSEHLRAEDFERFAIHRKKRTPIDITADVRVGGSWQPASHSRSVKISHAKLLLFEQVRDALRQAKQDFDYEYLHIHGILDDVMNVCRAKPGGGLLLNFVYVDLVVDFILSIGMKPWMELGYTPGCLIQDPNHFLSDSCLDLPDVPEQWETLVESLLQHFIHKYGKEQVQQWRFAPVYELYSYYQIYSLPAYLEHYAHTYRVIRSNLPKAIITGWGFQLETITEAPDSDFSRAISFCKERSILPDLYDFQFFHIDFSKVNEAQFGQAIHTQHQALAVVHHDAELLSAKMSVVKGHLQQHGMEDSTCVVGSWNCGLWQRELSNDTCFKSAFLVKNVLENTDGIDEITYCNLTDLTEQTLTTPTVFHGGNGLVTYQNIPKAAYYAFSFLNCLSDVLVEKGKSYCITRTKDHRQIDILLYHYRHYVQSFSESGVTGLIPESVDRYGVYGYHIPIAVRLHLRRMLPGKYMLERRMVNREHGSSYDTWVEMGSPREMSGTQRRYLSQQSIPRYVCQTVYVDNQGTLDLSTELQLYEIQHIRLKISDS